MLHLVFERARKFAEADQPKYDSLHLKNPLHTFRYPADWVVDAERDALMVDFGGRGYLPPERAEPPYFYAFAWHGQIVELEAYYSSKTLATGEFVPLHQITCTKVPKALENKIESMKTLVAEALVAFEHRRKYPAKTVTFEFSKILYV